MTIQGAKRADAWEIRGKDIEDMDLESQTRWGGHNELRLLDLAEKIARMGQLVPVTVRVLPDNKTQLIAGFCRRLAVLHINEHLSEYGIPEPLPLIATEYTCDDRGAIVASYMSNVQASLSVMDLAYTANLFRNMYKMSGAETARAMTTDLHTVTEARVSALLRLIKSLPQKTQLALHTGTITEAAATALLQVKAPVDEIEATTEKLVKGELDTKDVVERSSAEKRAKGKTIKRTMKTLRDYLGARETVNSRKMIGWLDGEKNDAAIAKIFADPKVIKQAKKPSRAQKKVGSSKAEKDRKSAPATKSIQSDDADMRPGVDLLSPYPDTGEVETLDV